MGYFNRFYKNISVMGKGSFAKVIQSLRIADKQEFAVKTFNKFKLTSQSNKNSNIQKVIDFFVNIGSINEGNQNHEINLTRKYY